MELSSEDSLRLNVLLAQQLHAVRIDDSSMTVYALSEKGEAKVKLNPTCKDEKYIRMVKELFSTHILGSPGGYPIFLRRWTRMGQARDESLEKLLLLGEPEAVVATVYAQGLSNELARRAWWAMPNANNARRMLEKKAVAEGDMGPTLAEFLIEFLPFEEEQQAVVDSVRLVLQPGLIDDKTRLELWNRGKRKNANYVGFLITQPHDLPEPASAHSQFASVRESLAPLLEQQNPYAISLERLLSPQGQSYLRTVESVMKKASSQDVIVALLKTMRDYLAEARIHEEHLSTHQELEQQTRHWLDNAEDEALKSLQAALPQHQEMINAMLTLSQASEQLVLPIFGLTGAVGSMMRKKIEPVVEPLQQQLRILNEARG